MNNFELAFTVGGIVYGALLIVATFVRSPLTELLRLDKLMFPRANESTRKLNLALGVLFCGYNVYTLYQAYTP